MRIPETQVGDPETFAIIGAAMEVHRILGCGFLEAAYAAALVIEMRLRGMPVEREVSYTIRYKGQDLLTRYRADLVCFGKVIVEVKATRAIGEVEMAQAMNYMRLWPESRLDPEFQREEAGLQTGGDGIRRRPICVIRVICGSLRT